jgi:hypothetical protein
LPVSPRTRLLISALKVFLWIEMGWVVLRLKDKISACLLYGLGDPMILVPSRSQGDKATENLSSWPCFLWKNHR